MAARRPLLAFVFVGALASMGATYRTQNFTVEAATPQVAEQVGRYAEHYRREKALLWLGSEMQPWPQPCPIRVTVTMNGSGGATSFVFDGGQVLGQTMHIEGTLDRLLASVLPHEVTHTVFAYHFRQPVPRWADEGGSVLSEDEPERKRHDKMVRQILNTRRSMPLRRLFALPDYPSDVMVLYAQGFSVCDFLVARSSRPAFLNFVADGIRMGWDQAVRIHYQFNSVDQLEQAWLDHLRNTRQPDLAAVASARPAAREPGAERVVTRMTAPPSQPLLEGPRPIVRGQMAEEESKTAAPYHAAAMQGAGPSCPNGWCPSPVQPNVRLGPPQIVGPGVGQ